MHHFPSKSTSPLSLKGKIPSNFGSHPFEIDHSAIDHTRTDHIRTDRNGVDRIRVDHIEKDSTAKGSHWNRSEEIALEWIPFE